MRSSVPDFLFVCVGPTCGERGGREILRAVKEALIDGGRWNERRAVPVSCFGLCAVGPNACALRSGAFVEGLDPRRPLEILERAFEEPDGEGVEGVRRGPAGDEKPA